MEAFNQQVRSHGVEANINCLKIKLDTPNEQNRFSHLPM